MFRRCLLVRKVCIIVTLYLKPWNWANLKTQQLLWQLIALLQVMEQRPTCQEDGRDPIPGFARPEISLGELVLRGWERGGELKQFPTGHCKYNPFLGLRVT